METPEWNLINGAARVYFRRDIVRAISRENSIVKGKR